MQHSPASSTATLSMSSTSIVPVQEHDQNGRRDPSPAASNHSPSPTRSPSRGRVQTTLADKISAIGAKIAHTLNITPEHEGVDHEGPASAHVAGTGAGLSGRGNSPGLGRWGVRRESSASGGYGENINMRRDDGADDGGTLNGNERSLSRGREAFQSSGRGGIGNIRATSLSRDARPDSGPDDFSATRGREPRTDQATPTAKVYSTGRGGVGNIRSPSRDVSSRGRSAVDTVEEQIIKEHLTSEHAGVHSTGRGGIGNIATSRSQSRARDSSVPPSAVAGRGSGTHTPLHSIGRGGAGKLSTQSAEDTEGQGHSTVKGGIANILAGVEHAFHHHGQHPHPPAGDQKETHESTAKGEAGNK
ncbi:hypothetical protein AX15_004871 [Amanita polypyramis BW_CC]|nr:hypothetical protein AX15_004871 [Amanita polypyramis BW_CC]